MARIAIMMADGCEEIEALTVVDLLRRAGLTIDMLAIEKQPMITGSHGIVIGVDAYLGDVNLESYDGIVLPGGMPGTTHLKESVAVCDAVKAFFTAGKLVAAICAAPTVLGFCGILEGKHATCYPGCEDDLTGALLSEDTVVCDGNIITSRGMGTAIPFGLELISYLLNADVADQLSREIVFK